jgi:hypothetical protein
MATVRVGHHSNSPFAPHSCLPDRCIRLVGQTSILRRPFRKRLLSILDKRRAPSDLSPSLHTSLALVLFLPVTLMIVKEASYPSLERRCLLQIADGTGAVEELPLELRGNSIPAHKHGRAQTLQNLLFFLGKGSTVLVILFPLNRLIEMNCQRVQSFLRINTANKKRSIASSLPCGGDE